MISTLPSWQYRPQIGRQSSKLHASAYPTGHLPGRQVSRTAGAAVRQSTENRVFLTSGKPLDATKELAKTAGIARSTMVQVKKIAAEASGGMVLTLLGGT